VSRKIERLINLTIALLATKRFLTKSEIFRTVEGYEGAPETKERMFERDKDDLRALGIQIEVGSFDHLFNDEAGYRIKAENYQLDLGEISSTQLSLLSLAANAWQGAALDDAAQRAILKLNSIGVPTDSTELPAISPKLANSSIALLAITVAIANKNILNFVYLSANLQQVIRAVIPFAIASRSGYWYMAGVDQDVQEIRIFRLDRFIGDVTEIKNSEEFDAPENFSFKEIFDESTVHEFAVVDVRKGKGHSLRILSTDLKDLGEWDQLRIPMTSVEKLGDQILWHGEDAFVHQPLVLRSYVVEALESLVRIHG